MVPHVSSECADAGGVLADGVVIHLASSETMNYLFAWIFIACAEL